MRQCCLTPLDYWGKYEMAATRAAPFVGSRETLACVRASSSRMRYATEVEQGPERWLDESARERADGRVER